jgi:hypothetical protein
LAINKSAIIIQDIINSSQDEFSTTKIDLFCGTKRQASAVLAESKSQSLLLAEFITEVYECSTQDLQILSDSFEKKTTESFDQNYNYQIFNYGAIVGLEKNENYNYELLLLKTFKKKLSLFDEFYKKNTNPRMKKLNPIILLSKKNSCEQLLFLSTLAKDFLPILENEEPSAETSAILVEALNPILFPENNEKINQINTIKFSEKESDALLFMIETLGKELKYFFDQCQAFLIFKDSLLCQKQIKKLQSISRREIRAKPVVKLVT